MSHDEYIKTISEGEDVSFDIPVQDTMCYTSTPGTPLYPTIYQTSGSYNYDLDINYPLFVLYRLWCLSPCRCC